MNTLYVGPDDALALRVARFLREHPIKPGTSGTIQVFHDDDCPKLYGGPRCECRPDFKLVEHAA